MYRQKFMKFLLIAMIGALCGALFIDSMGGEGVDVFLGLLVGAGIPSGWMLSGKVLGGFLVGSLPIMAVSIMIRVMIAIVVGMIAFPIMLVYYIIQMCREKVQVKDDV